MADSSFDIVSKIDRQEADNALNQARKEVEQRGMLISSGLITGEALVGLAMAIPIVISGRADVLAFFVGLALRNLRSRTAPWSPPGARWRPPRVRPPRPPLPGPCAHATPQPGEGNSQGREAFWRWLPL